MQANSMLALSGLVYAVTKYRSGEDMAMVLESESHSAHMKHKQWVSLITDSLLSIWNVKYKPSSNALLGLCQQVTIFYDIFPLLFSTFKKQVKIHETIYSSVFLRRQILTRLVVLF